MLLVALAWMYVVLMVAVVQATGDGASVTHAVFTILFYGVLPVGILGYLFLSPARRRVRRAQAEDAPDAPGPAGGSIPEPDHGGHAAGEAVAPVREET